MKKRRVVGRAAVPVTTRSLRQRKKVPGADANDHEPSSISGSAIRQSKEPRASTESFEKPAPRIDDSEDAKDAGRHYIAEPTTSMIGCDGETENKPLQSEANTVPPSSNSTEPSNRKRNAKKPTNKHTEPQEPKAAIQKPYNRGRSSSRRQSPRKKGSIHDSKGSQSPHVGFNDKSTDIAHTSPTTRKRKRKTAEEKLDEVMPLANRTPNLRMFVGAHVSMAKGVQNSVTNSHHIGGNAFALFLKSQRKWDNPALKEENRDAFQARCHAHQYDASSHVLPHGSYLVNLAVDDADKARQAYDAFVDDLHRCEALGIRLYNFHPGAAGHSPVPEAIKRLSTQLNKALAATKSVIPVLENMAGSGTVIGSRFSELRDIIDHIRPEFQSRIGVCIDTCHAFAAGYDLRTPESYRAVLEEFNEVVGLKHLKALHLNDSKAPFGSNKDLHQNIGLGFLGLRAFHNVMNDKNLEGLPLILETPCDRADPSDPVGKRTIEDKGVWAKEIKMLEGLIGMNTQSEKFKKLEIELSESGRLEREEMSRVIEERERKQAAKGKVKGKLTGQKNLLEMMDSRGKKVERKALNRKSEEAVESENGIRESEGRSD